MTGPENVRKTGRGPWADPALLLCRAEEKIRTPPALESRTLSFEEAEPAFEELQVHQIELEMQHEERLNAQVSPDISRPLYFDTYDLAPIGYCKLSPRGIILEANLTAATLVGMERGALDNLEFARFIQSVCTQNLSAPVRTDSHRNQGHRLYPAREEFPRNFQPSWHLRSCSHFSPTGYPQKARSNGQEAQPSNTPGRAAVVIRFS